MSNSLLNNKEIYKQPISYILGTLLFFLLAIVCFIWQIWSSLSPSLPIDHAIWGQFGDFVGGTLGVIFSLISVIFVVITFQTQQRSAYEQRFNDMFFETLRIYHEQEKELQIKYTEENEDETYEGESNYKDFFDRVRVEISKKFNPSPSFSRNRKDAIRIYAETCVVFGGKLSLCYKSIYRLLDIIDSSNISNEVRLSYAKLLRSQFTENELLCLRYHIKFGDYRKFAYLVNKYNVMKHLPIFDLFEFAYWSTNQELSDVEKREVGNFFIIVSKYIKNRQSNKIYRCQNRLIFELQVSPCRMKIVCKKYPLLQTNQDNLACLYKFDTKTLENLLECVMKEIVVFSNFSCYNNFNELLFNSKTQHEDDNCETTEVSVYNRRWNYIILTHNESPKHPEDYPMLH